MTPVTEVAAAVIQRPDGSFLLAQRPAGKPYPGYWEFPGGKVEPGESAIDALKREIREELDVEIVSATPWVTRVHAYTHATVRLHFFRVTEWRGEFHGMEDQAHTWQRVDALDVGPMLPANTPIFRALSLPPVYGITNASELGASVFLLRLEQALERGLRLIQFREKGLPADTLPALATDVVKRAHARGARVLINGDVELARSIGADGVHLAATQIARMESRPDFSLVGASCHTREELNHAAAINLDFAVLGAVKNTLTHPGQSPMGWERFQALMVNAPIPVYGIGGLAPGDLPQAQQCGAHGIAMQREAWMTAQVPSGYVRSA
jgi:8-oxo-dGTP diphosphatase